MDTSPPPFDAAAEAARFCTRAVERAGLIRHIWLWQLQGAYTALDYHNDIGDAADALDHQLLAWAWAEYTARGGTLGELYGVAS